MDPSLKFKKDLASLISAGVQALMIDTPEVRRAEQLIIEVAKSAGRTIEYVWAWDVIGGFQLLYGDKDQVGTPSSGNYTDVYMQVAQHTMLPSKPLKGVGPLPQRMVRKGNAVVIIRNPHLTFNAEHGPRICQILQSTVQNEAFNSVAEDGDHDVCIPILISNGGTIPPAIKDLCVDLPLPFPSLDHILADFDYIAKTTKSDYTPEAYAGLRTSAGKLLQGLPASQVSLALSKAAVRLESSFLTETLLGELELAKVDLLKQATAIEYVPKSKIHALGDVGGFKELKDWILARKLCFTEEAEAELIDKPKGFGLIGMPGTGKTRLAKLAALLLDLPLLILDIGALFGGVVGETEKATRNVFRTLEAVGPHVLLLDEVEKALAGMNSASGSGDSGVGKRMFGTLLSWLSDNQHGIFVIATMNRADNIDAEFLRKGRFDDVFAVDLPTADEREEIARIHLLRRGIAFEQVYPTAEAVQSFHDACGKHPRHTGAEIETAIVEARLEAFQANQASPSRAGVRGVPTAKQLNDKLKKIRCLADDPDTLEKFRKATTAFKSASLPALQQPPRSRRVGAAS